MFFFQYSYLLILIYSLVISIILFILIFISYIVSQQQPNLDKLSAYECGYEAFNDTQQQQDIRYFIIGLLFIVFDIELMFLFPWVSVLSMSNIFHFIIGLEFIIELGISFIIPWLLYIYDWK